MENQAENVVTDGRKHRALILMPGPKFDLDWEFSSRLTGLSNFSAGYLVTSSSSSRRLRIRNYEVVTTLYDPSSALSWVRSRFSYLRRCVSTIRSAKRAHAPIELIVCYDPLLTGIIGWMLATAFRARLICEVNGSYTDAANFQHVRWRPLRAVKRRLAGALVRWVLSRSHGIKVLYSSQLEEIGYTPRCGQTVMQVPEFVNIGAFSDLGEEKTVLLVGFPFYVKGVDIAIAAFKRIQAQYPDWSLKIIGHYPDKSQLEAAIGQAERISHHMPVLHRDMNEHIGRSAIVLQCSRTEAMGRVLVEAMAAAKPRVASNVGGIPTVVADGVDGVLVENEDVEGFARALSRLMGDAELRRRLGKAGAERAARDFSTASYAVAIERLFDRVAA